MYPAQKRLYKKWRSTKIKYSDFNGLAYVSRDLDTLEHEIVLGKQATPKILMPVLFHEMGHLELGHLGYEHSEQAEKIDEIMKKYNVPWSKFYRAYGTLANFLNICQDLEVNSKFLTKSDAKSINKVIDPSKIYTLSEMNLEFKYRFYGYYEDLISRLNEEDLSDDQCQFTLPIKADSNDQNDSNVSGGESDKEDQQNGGSNGKYKYKAPDDVERGKDKDNSKSNDDDGDENKPNILDETTIEDIFRQMDPVEVSEINAEIRAEEKENQQRDAAMSSEYLSKIKGDSPSNKMKRFLESLLKYEYNHTVDHIRVYNRQSRGSSDIMYSSIRSKHNKNRTKLGILIDVSGSMNPKEVITAVSSIDKSIINPKSTIMLWSKRKMDKFTVNDIPDSYRTGGGTYKFHEGVQELIDDGMNKIVIYSDFELYDEDKFFKYLKREGIKFDAIVVNGKSEVVLSDYIKNDLINKHISI